MGYFTTVQFLEDETKKLHDKIEKLQWIRDEAQKQQQLFNLKVQILELPTTLPGSGMIKIKKLS